MLPNLVRRMLQSLTIRNPWVLHSNRMAVKPDKILCVFILLVAGFFILIPDTRGQIMEYVRNNAVPLKSVDLNDTAFDDLLPVARAIGNKRIVMLGELFHGDATTFEAKARLIKFLHQKMGFNVLAFEGDFFALNHGWQRFKNGEIKIDTFLQSSIFPVWTCCKQCSAVFNYIMDSAEGDHPLTITGFDNQIMSGYTTRNLQKYVSGILNTSKIGFSKNAAYSRYLSLLDSPAIARGAKCIPLFDSLINYTSTILTQTDSILPKDEFPAKVFENLLVFYKQARYYWDTQKQDSGYSPFRDYQMAENLKWLATRKYPGEKILVWAHNAHIFKNSDVTFNKKTGQGYSMGYYFTRDKILMDQTYIIGFTEYSGFGKFINQKNAVKVTRPNSHGLEQWLNDRGYPFAFIDFSGFSVTHPENRETFYMKREIFAEEKSFWHRFYDGIFFIQKMEPCESTIGILKNK